MAHVLLLWEISAAHPSLEGVAAVQRDRSWSKKVLQPGEGWCGVHGMSQTERGPIGRSGGSMSVGAGDEQDF